MKCPKCGFISFDHNETCPKCKKDISREREKMRHIHFRPNEPFLLAALIGEIAESRTRGESREPDMLKPLDSGAFELETPSGELSLEKDPEPEALPERTRSDYLFLEDEEIPLGSEEPDLGMEDLFIETQNSSPSGASGPPKQDPPSTLTGFGAGSPLDGVADHREGETTSEREDEPFEAQTIITVAELDEPPLQTPPGKIGTAEPGESRAITEKAPLEAGDQKSVDLPLDNAPQYKEEADKLFSLDNLKEEKAVEQGLSDALPSPPGPETGTSPGSGFRSSGTSGVWTEIARDLEDLDFDIKDSN